MSGRPRRFAGVGTGCASYYTVPVQAPDIWVSVWCGLVGPALVGLAGLAEQRCFLLPRRAKEQLPSFASVLRVGLRGAAAVERARWPVSPQATRVRLLRLSACSSVLFVSVCRRWAWARRDFWQSSAAQRWVWCPRPWLASLPFACS